MTTYDQSTDDIFGVVNTTVTNGAPGIVGYVPEMRWQNVEEPATPPVDQLWLRTSLQTVINEQATLSTDEGTAGQKRYDIQGLVFVQIFLPRSVATSGADGRKVGEMLVNAFRGTRTTNGVWFRNARVQELAPEDSYFRFNVVSEFHYSDIQ